VLDQYRKKVIHVLASLHCSRYIDAELG